MYFKSKGKRNNLLIEEKRKVKYGLKKLNVGVVSCIVGCTILFGNIVPVSANVSWNNNGEGSIYYEGQSSDVDKWLEGDVNFDEERNQVTYTFSFNKDIQGIPFKAPMIYLVLPEGIDLDKATITVQQNKKVIGLNKIIQKDVFSGTIDAFDASSNTKWVYKSKDSSGNFNAEFDKYILHLEETDEYKMWRDEGKYSVILINQLNTEDPQYSETWTITAPINEGIKTYDLYHVFGMNSVQYNLNITRGGHDSDGDSYSDLRELYEKTNPDDFNDKPEEAKDKYQPQVAPLEVKKGTPITEDEVKGKVTIPEGSGGKIVSVTDIPTTEEAGVKTPAKVVVEYPDKTRDTVEIPVTVTEEVNPVDPIDPVKTEADVKEPSLKDTNPVVTTVGAPFIDEAIIGKVDVPEGGKATVTEKPGENIKGEGTATVDVEYADGSKDTITVPTKVVDLVEQPQPDIENQSSGTTNNTSSGTTNNTSINNTSSNVQKTLPQTGEENSTQGILYGLLVSMLGLLGFVIKRNEKKSVRD